MSTNWLLIVICSACLGLQVDATMQRTRRTDCRPSISRPYNTQPRLML